MKARIFQTENYLECQFENGEILEGIGAEDYNDFVVRVKDHAEETFMEEVDIEKVTMSKLKKFGSTRFNQAIETASGLHLDMLLDIQNQRADVADVEVATQNVDAKEVAKLEALAAKAEQQAAKEAIIAEREAKREARKVEKEAAKVAKAARLEAQKAEKEAVKAKRKAEREAKKQSLEEVLEENKALQANKGSVVSFVDFKTKETLTGVINGVVADKRVPMNLYRVHVGEGADLVIRHCRPSNNTLVIDEAATEARRAELQKVIDDAAAAKEAAAKAKADAKAAKEAAKAAKIQAKAEELVAKAAAAAAAEASKEAE